MICNYGCGREAKYQFKNGKWCCSKSWRQCSTQRKRNSMWMKKVWEDPDSIFNSDSYKEKRSNIMKKARNDPTSKFNSKIYKEKVSSGLKKARKDPTSKYNSDSYKEKRSNIMKKMWKEPDSGINNTLTIEKINKKYPFFSKIEELRYNPNKTDEKEIQVHCKNHECENSKEKGGWFTPKYEQLQIRKSCLENEGVDNSYFYCSQHCKDTCVLFRLRNDPYKDNNKPYTSAELDTFNKHILKRDNEICYYCKKHHATIVHHLRPKKLEPFFALDPDHAISVCKKCHYKYGHPTGSEYSTGNLAKIVCSVESQKFLNQKI